MFKVQYQDFSMAILVKCVACQTVLTAVPPGDWHLWFDNDWPSIRGQHLRTGHYEHELLWKLAHEK
jgi:hypothetical protein